eukprot:gene17196-8738_t
MCPEEECKCGNHYHHRSDSIIGGTSLYLRICEQRVTDAHMNKSLKLEKQKYMKEAIRKAKEQEVEMQKRTEVTYEEVEAALKEKLAAARVEEEQVKELKKQISRLIEEIAEVNLEVARFVDFKDRQRFENDTHIKLLKKEMDDMHESYGELSEFFVKNLENVKLQIERATEENITNEKKLASELALESLDSSSHQEFSDNKWLLQEVHIHREHLADISAIVDKLEKENVETMGDLLRNQFEDVKISRDFFSACNSSDDESENEEGCEEIIASHFDDGDTENQVDSKWLDNYFSTFGDDAEEDNQRLAPMDLKLLCVVGKKKKIHTEISEKERRRIESAQDRAVDKSLIWLNQEIS